MIVEHMAESFFRKSLEGRNSKSSGEVEYSDMRVKTKLKPTVLCCVGGCIKEFHQVVDGLGIVVCKVDYAAGSLLQFIRCC